MYHKIIYNIIDEKNKGWESSWGILRDHRSSVLFLRK
jgi:hypothetical protein